MTLLNSIKRLAVRIKPELGLEMDVMAIYTFSLSIMHRICFPQPTTQKWTNILHKHCFQCLLGSKIVPKVTAKQRMQDLGGANKVQRFEKILVVKDLSHLCSKEAEVKRMCLSLFHDICWGYEMKIIVNDFSDLSNDHHQSKRYLLIFNYFI